MTDVDLNEALRALLDRWADAVNRHDPERVANLFTPDALFQGFDPIPGRGQSFIAGYYDKQPVQLRAHFEVLNVKAAGAGAMVGFARVEFHRPEGVVPVYLTLVAENWSTGWRISHYHVSKVATD